MKPEVKFSLFFLTIFFCIDLLIVLLKIKTFVKKKEFDNFLSCFALRALQLLLHIPIVRSEAIL